MQILLHRTLPAASPLESLRTPRRPLDLGQPPVVRLGKLVEQRLNLLCPLAPRNGVLIGDFEEGGSDCGIESGSVMSSIEKQVDSPRSLNEVKGELVTTGEERSMCTYPLSANVAR